MRDLMNIAAEAVNEALERRYDMQPFATVTGAWTCPPLANDSSHSSH